MIYQRFLAAFFVFFIRTDLLASGLSVCDNINGNYTSNSAYSVNLNATLSSLSTNIGGDGFYNASAGEGADGVNAAAMCRGDLQLERCRDCVRTAGAELLEWCPNQKQAIRWDDSCVLRYSNASIYGVLATIPMYYVWTPVNVTSPEQFMADLRALLDNLRLKAAAGVGAPLRKVAGGNVTGPDSKTIFGLVQCTPDLSTYDCTSCLVGIISKIPDCCNGKSGGRVLQPSCNLHFETYPIFNETGLQELEFEPLPPPPPPPSPVKPPMQSSPEKKNNNTTQTIIIAAAAIVVCLILVVLATVFLRRRKRQKPTESPQIVEEISIAESLQYAFNTIKDATNNFSNHNKLGQGGFGTVYKGKLSDGQEIAVKRLSMDSRQGDLEFKNEVLLLAKLQHRNLVRLLGFALEGMEKLLVYELVQNASLDHFIFDADNRLGLDWDRRYKIIAGIARGILYLHEDSRLRIIHRDLKASNILLDGDMIPKIADFGMARLFRQDETRGNTSRVVGTYGYMSPEYLMHGQFSIKSDVYSFGVLVLEIMSGRLNNGFRSGEGVDDLLSFAWKSWQEGRCADVVDPSLRSGSGSMNEMLRCIQIGLLCVQEDAADRPTMASVVLMLGSFSITLDMPSEPAFYSSAPASASDVSLVLDSDSTNSDHKRLPRLLHQSRRSVEQLHPR